MYVIKYPITGLFREPSIILIWLLIFLNIEFAIMFFVRFVDYKKENRDSQDLSYFFLFSLMGLYWVISLLVEFYVVSDIFRESIYFIGILSVLIGFEFFFLLSEKKANPKYRISILYPITIALGIVFQIFGLNSMKYSLLISWITFLILYYKNSNHQVILELESKNIYYLGLLGICLSLGGTFLNLNIILSTLGPLILLIGIILQIIGSISLFIAFYKLPVMEDYDWMDYVESIFLIDDAGAPIFYKIIQSEANIPHQNLVSSAIKSINIMLEQVTNYKGISIIKKENNTTIIYPGEYITGVIFCSKKLESINKLLKNLVERVENLYEKILPSWDGDLEIFSPIEDIFLDLFQSQSIGNYNR